MIASPLNTIERELKKYYRIRRIMKEDEQDYNLLNQLYQFDETISKYEKLCGKTEEDFIVEAL